MFGALLQSAGLDCSGVPAKQASPRAPQKRRPAGAGLPSAACFGSEELLLGFFGRSGSSVGSRSSHRVGGRGGHRVGSGASSGSSIASGSGSIASGSGSIASGGSGVASGVGGGGSSVGGGIGGFGGGFRGGVSVFFGLVASRQSEDASGQEDVKLRVHASLQRSCLKKLGVRQRQCAGQSGKHAGLCSFTDLLARSAPLGTMKKPQADLRLVHSTNQFRVVKPD